MASVGAAGLVVVGCGDDDDDGDGGGNTLERAQETGRIRIGFANERPYGFADSGGNVTGEAPTVARAVLEELGITEIDAVVVPFGSLRPGLQADRFDIIAAGMFITPDRCEDTLFSDPDYCVPQAFAVEAGNPMDISDFASIAESGASVGMPSGVVEEGFALDAGVSEDQITLFDDLQGAGDALAAGRVDAVAATSLAIQSELERLGDDGLEMTDPFEVVIDGQPQSGCGAYGFRPDDEELRDAFNDILVEMKENGEIRPLVEEFGFTSEVEAAQGRTMDELCEG